MHAFDRRTDRRTEFSSLDRVCIPCSSAIIKVALYLRSITRECVHIVTRGHSRSPNKDGGHTIRSAIAEDPRYMETMYLLEIEVLHCGNRDFRLPVTLTLTRWHSWMNVTRIPWRYTGCANMNFLTSRPSKVIVWQTYTHTYTTEVKYDASSRGWSIKGGD